MSLSPVSYTHLDVYKRQPVSVPQKSVEMIRLANQLINHPLVRDLKLIQKNSANNAIKLELSANATASNEGYQLSVSSSGITIKANTERCV